jgi:hypothetical protein
MVTDSAANCKAAGEILMEKHPHLTWSPCAAHILDLLLEDIARIPSIKTTIENGRRLLAFIANHQIPYAIFKGKAKGAVLVKYGPTRQVITISFCCISMHKYLCCRFGTNFLMLRSLVKAKGAIKEMMTCEKYTDWAASQGSAIRRVAHDCEDLVIQSDFWRDAAEVLQV